MQIDLTTFHTYMRGDYFSGVIGNVVGSNSFLNISASWNITTDSGGSGFISNHTQGSSNISIIVIAKYSYGMVGSIMANVFGGNI